MTQGRGAVTSVSRLDLWSEEGAGIGTLDLFGSVDGSDFSSLAPGLTPTDNPPSPGPFILTSCGADVFEFGGYRSVRYVRFAMSDCPQPDPASHPGCGMGEVAFAEGTADDPGAVAAPEPASARPLLGGLLGVGSVARRRHREERGPRPPRVGDATLRAGLRAVAPRESGPPPR